MPKTVSVIRGVDDVLRQAGFRIESRPAAGPTLWRRNGVSLTQRQALNIARMEGDRLRQKIKDQFVRVNG